MNGCRKSRLPIEAEKLPSLYPDLEDIIKDEWGGDDDVEKFVDYIETTQMTSQQTAGDALTHSKCLMKKQYDKKLNLKSFEKLQEADVVLMENISLKMKDGKFQDKWIGP